MIFGPQQVIMVAGLNKIVTDVTTAIKRIEAYAPPMDSKRRGSPNPCTVTGMCINCQSPNRICKVTTIMHKRPRHTKIHIFIVGEELGF